ncbi:MAG TPA: cytochrome C oxidase subunit IV family protein [Candidatus Limnocylindria bacterium]|nr:cytochrome C oxidase subunit IV family protein [Candidatus Limnocylindria bacterium]
MAQNHHHGANPYVIWVWLVVLLAAGFIAFAFHLSTMAAVLILFSLAIVKAGLVVRHYMHMYDQPVALYAIAGIPVLLMIFMVVSLLPDIAFHSIPPVPAAEAPPH